MELFWHKGEGHDTSYKVHLLVVLALKDRNQMFEVEQSIYILIIFRACSRKTNEPALPLLCFETSLVILTTVTEIFPQSDPALLDYTPKELVNAHK